MYRKSPIIFECVSKVACKETASNQDITNPASTLRYSINQWIINTAVAINVFLFYSCLNLRASTSSSSSSSSASKENDDRVQ